MSEPFPGGHFEAAINWAPRFLRLGNNETPLWLECAGSVNEGTVGGPSVYVRVCLSMCLRVFHPLYAGGEESTSRTSAFITFGFPSAALGARPQRAAPCWSKIICSGDTASITPSALKSANRSGWLADLWQLQHIPPSENKRNTIRTNKIKLKCVNGQKEGYPRKNARNGKK